MRFIKSAEELDNVSKACRIMGYSRDKYGKVLSPPPEIRYFSFPSRLGANANNVMSGKPSL